MNKIKIILIYIFLYIFCISSVNASYDEEYTVNLWSLGDLTTYSPLNFYDFSVVEDNSTVKISYTAYDCDSSNDFFIYINGFQNINCTGGYDNSPHIESMEFTMDSGTYELYFDYNVNDFYQIGDVLIQIENPVLQEIDQDIYINNTSNFFGDLEDYFNEDTITLEDLIMIEIGLYMFALICVFIFKSGDITIKRFNNKYY